MQYGTTCWFLTMLGMLASNLEGRGGVEGRDCLPGGLVWRPGPLSQLWPWLLSRSLLLYGGIHGSGFTNGRSALLDLRAVNQC